MATFGFPTAARLRLIAQAKVATLTLNDPIFEFLPITTEEADTILWEQKDDYRGVQNIRGLGGQFRSVARVGLNRYAIIPGYYGDKSMIDEVDLTRLREPGTFGAPIDASRLVLDRQEQLLSREIDGMRLCAWSIVQGRFTRLDPDTGAVLYTDAFNLQTYNGSNWFVTTTGTPMADIRAMKPLARAKGVRFDRSAKLFLNTYTTNAMMNNTNANDLGGKRSRGGDTANLSLGRINEIMVENDLPMIVEWDDGYLDDAGTYVPFLADGRGVLFGQRIDGSPIGSIVQTKNASNPGQAAGPYDDAVESNSPPKVITVYRGVNYGPILSFPGSIVRLGCGPTPIPAIT